MRQPIANAETGVVVFPKPGKTEKVKEEHISVHIPERLMSPLRDLATADGFIADAKTDAGVKQQTNKACRAYILIAIERLIADRQAMAEEEE